ncbi:MAG: hypothetical protein NVS1B11_12100 [Terriglobales bacterium]
MNASGDGFLWEELLDAAREDRNLLEFFRVNEINGSVSENPYISPDWPSAVAKSRLASEPLNDYEGKIGLESELAVSFSQVREHRKPTEFTRQ